MDACFAGAAMVCGVMPLEVGVALLGKVLLTLGVAIGLIERRIRRHP